MQETWEDYSCRIERLELGRALIRLSRSDDAVTELELMSQRIIDKLNSAIFNAVKSVPREYNSDAALASYKRNYLDKFGPVADHIED